MRTVALITAVFAEVDAQRGALPTHPEAPLCAQWPWGGGRPAQAWAIGPALAGWRVTLGRCFPASPRGPGSCVCSRRLTTGRRSAWPLRRSSASSTR